MYNCTSTTSKHAIIRRDGRRPHAPGAAPRRPRDISATPSPRRRGRRVASPKHLLDSYSSDTLALATSTHARSPYWALAAGNTASTSTIPTETRVEREGQLAPKPNIQIQACDAERGYPTHPRQEQYSDSRTVYTRTRRSWPADGVTRRGAHAVSGLETALRRVVDDPRGEGAHARHRAARGPLLNRE